MQKYVLFIGIDISKNWIDVCLTLDGRKKSMTHFRVDNNDQGFKQMLRLIGNSKEFRKEKSEWIFLMEHTGVYSMPLCNFLEQRNLSYCMLNPLELKYSMGIKRGKSDEVDAADIAHYAYKNREELSPTVLPSAKLLKIKSLLSLRSRLVKCRHGLHVAAKELAAFTSKEVHGEVFSISKANIKSINKDIAKVEKQISATIASDDELQRLYDLATSVIGVGIVIASAMLVYTNGFTAFKTARQFCVYTGLVPFGKKSGSSVDVPARVSHLAHKKLKGYISNGASVATMYDKQLKAYNERRLAEGKNQFVVQNAIRAKFVNIIFAVVKRGTPYVALAQHKA